MLRQLPTSDRSGRVENGCEEKTHCYRFSANVREHGLSEDTTGTEELAFGPRAIVVRKWSWILPVSEPDAIVFWIST